MGLAPMERVEKMNMVMACPQQREWFVQQNPYAMEVDRSNRNCYSCESFGHFARNCRNRRVGNRIGERRRLEYGSNKNNEQRRIEGENGQNNENNLNGEQDLILLN